MRAEVFFGDIIGCHIHYSGWYELPVVRAVVPFLGPDTVFVDVGANIGQYTLLASPFVRQVIAFEPNPATYALLEGNVRRNRLRNVSLYQAAVSSSDGEAFIFDSDPGNHGGASMQGAEGGKRITTRALDSVLDERACKEGRLFLKVDVEGAELDVLRGAAPLIEMCKPTILVEVLETNQNRFGRTGADILDALRDHGYSFQSVSEAGLAPYDARYPNVLATVHGSPHSEESASRNRDLAYHATTSRTPIKSSPTQQ